jgi:hypothetical protein
LFTTISESTSLETSQIKMPTNTPEPQNPTKSAPQTPGAQSSQTVEAKARSPSKKGKIVILMNPAADHPATQAIDLKEWGRVHVAAPSADFNVLELGEEGPGGYVVAGQHKDVLNYVPPGEVKEGAPSMVAGLIGRGYRDEDAKDLRLFI